MTETIDPALFEMPETTPGETVVWYMNGTREGRKPIAATISKVNARTVSLVTSDGRPFFACRHIDDPKLELSPEQREDGAWDYTQSHYDNRRVIQELQNRVEALEAMVFSGGTKPVEEMSYPELKKYYKVLCPEFTGHVKKPELIEMIHAAERLQKA